MGTTTRYGVIALSRNQLVMRPNVRIPNLDWYDLTVGGDLVNAGEFMNFATFERRLYLTTWNNVTPANGGLWYCPDFTVTVPRFYLIKDQVTAAAETGYSGTFGSIAVRPTDGYYCAPFHTDGPIPWVGAQVLVGYETGNTWWTIPNYTGWPIYVFEFSFETLHAVWGDADNNFYICTGFPAVNIPTICVSSNGVAWTVIDFRAVIPTSSHMRVAYDGYCVSSTKATFSNWDPGSLIAGLFTDTLVGIVSSDITPANYLYEVSVVYTSLLETGVVIGDSGVQFGPNREGCRAIYIPGTDDEILWIVSDIATLAEGNNVVVYSTDGGLTWEDRTDNLFTLLGGTWSGQTLIPNGPRGNSLLKAYGESLITPGIDIRRFEMPSFDPAKSAFSRIFLIEGGARPDHTPKYMSCMKASGVSQSFGDITKIECPSSEEYGQFEEVGQIQGAVERATSSLIGRYASDLESDMLRIAKQRCSIDVQVHIGKCTDPRVFNVFTKNFIWEGVSLTNYSTDDLGALGSDENAVINQTSDLSIQNIYEVLPLTFSERASDIMTNEVVDVVICDRISCGDCDNESDGCQRIYEIVGGITGSPGTPPDIKYSLDKGLTWALNEVTSLTPGEAAHAIACLGDYLFVVSNASNSLHWKTLANVNAGTVGGWTEVATGFVAAAEPRDVWSVGVGAFIVGDSGYVYWTDDPTNGVSVLDAGIATSNQLNAVHAISDEFAVAVGNSDTIIFTNNRVNWQAAGAVTGTGANLVAVWVVNEEQWWVLTTSGGVYYTLDGGDSWTAVTLPGNKDTLHNIAFSSKSIGYICGSYSNAGRAWRTYDGGYSWVSLPEGSGNLPTARDLNALAACEYDQNFVVIVGEGSAVNDGINMVGED